MHVGMQVGSETGMNSIGRGIKDQTTDRGGLVPIIFWLFFSDPQLGGRRVGWRQVYVGEVV